MVYFTKTSKSISPVLLINEKTKKRLTQQSCKVFAISMGVLVLLIVALVTLGAYEIGVRSALQNMKTTVADPVETTVVEPDVKPAPMGFRHFTLMSRNGEHCSCISKSVYDSANFVSLEIYMNFGQEITKCVQWKHRPKRIECLVDLLGPHTSINLTLLDNQVNTTLNLLGIIIVPDNEMCVQPENDSMVCLASASGDGREHPSTKGAHACMQEQTWPARVVCLATLYHINLMVQGQTEYPQDGLTTYEELLSDLERILLRSCGVAVHRKPDWRCTVYLSSSLEVDECRELGHVQSKQPAEFHVYPPRDADQNGTNPLDILPIVSNCTRYRNQLNLIDCLAWLLSTTIKVADTDYLEKAIIEHLHNLGYALTPNTPEYSNLVRLEGTKAVADVDSIHICMQEPYLSIRVACLALLFEHYAVDSYPDHRWRMYLLELELLGSIGLTIEMKTDWLCLLYKSTSGDRLIQQTTYECHELVQMS